jgi:hypothetical protein
VWVSHFRPQCVFSSQSLILYALHEEDSVEFQEDANSCGDDEMEEDIQDSPMQVEAEDMQ